MSDEALLRKVICDRPEDDTPRLVLADLLQQRGDPYGEFIAVQCALAHPERADRAALLSRERALWAIHGASWCAALGVERGQVTFTRGFPSALSTSGDVPVETSLLSGQPWESLSIEQGSHVTEDAGLVELFGALTPRTLRYHRMTFGEGAVSGKDPVLTRILASEAMSCVREIDIAMFLFNETEDLFSIIARNPSVRSLKSLCYSAVTSHQKSLIELLSSKICEGLREILLGSGQRSSDEPIAPILRALPPSVRALGIGRGAPEDIDAIPAYPFESLRWSIALSPERLSALLRGRDGLRSLSLRGCGLDGAHVEVLRGCPSLRELFLSLNNLDGAAVARLAEVLPAAGLESIDLSSNHKCLSTDEACGALARRVGRPRSLRVNGTGIGTSGIRILAESGALSSLASLSVRTLDPSAIQILAEASPGLVSLEIDRLEPATIAAISDLLGDRIEELRLVREISEEVARALAQVQLPRLSLLRALLGISAAAMSALERAPWLPGLAHARLPLRAEGSPR